VTHFYLQLEDASFLYIPQLSHVLVQSQKRVFITDCRGPRALHVDGQGKLVAVDLGGGTHSDGTS
jgi:hypothetical protein